MLKPLEDHTEPYNVMQMQQFRAPENDSLTSFHVYAGSRIVIVSDNTIIGLGNVHICQ